MGNGPYDITKEDLNPQFLFSSVQDRREDEQNYHAHDFIELVVILKGEGRFCVDGEEYLVKEGNLLILNPGTYHRSLRKPGGTGCARECYVGFSGVDFQGCEPGYLPLFQGQKKLILMPESMKKEVFRLCGAMEKESEDLRAGRYFMMKAYLIQLLCLIIREQQEEDLVHRKGYIFKSTGKKYVVQQITRYMEEHYREKISLDQIAENMYLSSYYISKIFKSETGDTPINYLISLRMEKAREILEKNPEISIQVVASRVGYEDAYHFSKLFKKYYGLPPIYYRGRQKGQEEFL